MGRSPRRAHAAPSTHHRNGLTATDAIAVSQCGLRPVSPARTSKMSPIMMGITVCKLLLDAFAAASARDTARSPSPRATHSPLPPRPCTPMSTLARRDPHSGKPAGTTRHPVTTWRPANRRRDRAGCALRARSQSGVHHDPCCIHGEAASWTHPRHRWQWGAWSGRHTMDDHHLGERQPMVIRGEVARTQSQSRRGILAPRHGWDTRFAARTRRTAIRVIANTLPRPPLN